MSACYIPNTISFQLIPFNSNNQTRNSNGFLLYILVLGCVCLSKMMIFKHLSNREESKMKNQMGKFWVYAMTKAMHILKETCQKLLLKANLIIPVATFRRTHYTQWTLKISTKPCVRHAAHA